MTENLAGRGEGLAGLREALKIATRELWHTQMPIAVNAAMPSVIPCVRDCVKCMCERALEAAAPAPTWDDAYAAGLKLRDTMREGVAALATPPQAQPLSECKNPDCPVGCPDSHALSFDPDRLPNVTVTTGGPPNASPPSWHEEPQVTTVNSDLALAHSAFKETYLQGNLPAATQEQPAGSGASENDLWLELAKILRFEKGDEDGDWFIPAEPQPLGPFFSILEAATAFMRFIDATDKAMREEIEQLRGSPRKVGEGGARTLYTLDDKLRALHEDNVNISQMLVMIAKDVNALGRPSSAPVGEQK